MAKSKGEGQVGSPAGRGRKTRPLPGHAPVATAGKPNPFTDEDGRRFHFRPDFPFVERMGEVVRLRWALEGVPTRSAGATRRLTRELSRRAARAERLLGRAAEPIAEAAGIRRDKMGATELRLLAPHGLTRRWAIVLDQAEGQVRMLANAFGVLAAAAAKAKADVTGKAGRPPAMERTVISKLRDVYIQGTGQQDLYTYDDVAETLRGPFVDFAQFSLDKLDVDLGLQELQGLLARLSKKGLMRR